MALYGKRILVTGASQGIGKALAIGLARAGAAIAVNYKSKDDEVAALKVVEAGEHTSTHARTHAETYTHIHGVSSLNMLEWNGEFITMASTLDQQAL